MKVYCVLKYLRSCLLISLVALGVSCEKEKSEQYVQLERLLKDVGYTGSDVPPNILMVPMDGCQPCIEESLSFALNNQYAEKLLIIPSGTSTKSILFKLNKAGFGTKGHLLLDSKGLTLKYGFVASNPLWVKVGQQDVEVVKLEPTNILAELENLKAKL